MLRAESHVAVIINCFCNYYYVTFDFMLSGNYVTEYVKMEGTVSFDKSSVPFATLETAEMCAQSCTKNVDCRMFEYCTNTKQCVHYYERSVGPQSNVTLTACNLYISKFL